MKSLIKNDSITVFSVDNNAKENTFSISNSKEFFNVLTSNLYTKPFVSCIRELLSNAHDAHIKANNLDTPIDVILDETEYSLTIKDYGTGIDLDKINDIFCVYGQSTKTNEDNQTGAFGLGCKIPFAICKSFTIKNRYKGKETTYLMYINKDGIPAYSIGSTVDTTKHDGLTISLDNIKQEYKYKLDFNTITDILNEFLLNNELYVSFYQYTDRRELNSIISYYPADFSNGFMIEYTKKIYGWSNKFKTNIKYGSCIFLDQKLDYYIPGDLYTKINNILLLNTPGSYEKLKSFEITLTLDIEPNTLTISPSRESIQYDEKARETITKAAQRLYNSLVEEANKRISTLAQQHNHDWNNVWTNLKTHLDFNASEILDDKVFTSVKDFIDIYDNRINIYYLGDLDKTKKEYPNIKYIDYYSLSKYLTGSNLRFYIWENTLTCLFTSNLLLDEIILLPNTIYINTFNNKNDSRVIYKLDADRKTRNFKSLCSMFKNLDITLENESSVKTQKELMLERLSMFDYYSSCNLYWQSDLSKESSLILKLLGYDNPIDIYVTLNKSELKFITKHTSLEKFDEVIKERFLSDTVAKKLILLFEFKALNKILFNYTLPDSATWDTTISDLILSPEIRNRYSLPNYTEEQKDFFSKLELNSVRWSSTSIVRYLFDLYWQEYKTLYCPYYDKLEQLGNDWTKYLSFDTLKNKFIKQGV